MSIACAARAAADRATPMETCLNARMNMNGVLLDNPVNQLETAMNEIVSKQCDMSITAQRQIGDRVKIPPLPGAVRRCPVHSSGYRADSRAWLGCEPGCRSHSAAPSMPTDCHARQG